MAPSWWPIRILKRAFFSVQTITLWQKKASSLTLYPALASMLTITAPVTTSPISTLITWIKRFTPCLVKWDGSPIPNSSRNGWKGKSHKFPGMVKGTAAVRRYLS